MHVSGVQRTYIRIIINGKIRMKGIFIKTEEGHRKHKYVIYSAQLSTTEQFRKIRRSSEIVIFSFHEHMLMIVMLSWTYG